MHKDQPAGRIRAMIARAAILIGVLTIANLTSGQASTGQASKIDRHALVSRHNITLTAFDNDFPVQVGNGEFAFGMDVTGLQTFVPFNTMSHWGWHSDPPPEGQKPSDFEGEVWDTHGRPVRYPMPDPNHPQLSSWLAANPHRINLGRVALLLTKNDGSLAVERDIEHPKQTVDLWNGIVTSRFEFEGQLVVVTTACHPTMDVVAVKVVSPLIRSGHLAISLSCPGDNSLQFSNFVGDRHDLADLNLAQALRPNRADFVRPFDKDTYYVSLEWQGAATLRGPQGKAPPIEVIKAEYGGADKWVDVTDLAKKATHGGRLAIHVGNSLAGDPIHGVVKKLRVEYSSGGLRQTAEAAENEDLIIDPLAANRFYTLQPAATSDEITFTCAFSPKPITRKLPAAEASFDACRRSWPGFWKSGGAIDLSGSSDPRWMELERRIVLSQYLMAVNEAGAFPPQESGLVNNGWFGRWHMEMYWWHAAHWALWNRWPQLDKSLGIYKQLLAGATRLAKSEGYTGARWPKCIGPDGREWPHVIHSLLIWQQPHPIFFAELDYRAHPTRETLEKWRPVVEATADFMASYAFHDEATKRYILGPPVVLVSENTDPKTTQNPTFELTYWRFGLRVAQEWRTRLGLAPKEAWSKVLAGLAPAPVQQGVYVLHEGVQDMWTHWNFEHPALTGSYGILPGDGIDVSTMRRTLDKVSATWDFNHTWGWDFPMLAMCAARLGEPDRAIDFLLTAAPGFQFDARGLATGGPIPYFPSNGGLLYAVALMAAGWDGAPKTHAPGFPSDARWKVRFENLSSAP